MAHALRAEKLLAGLCYHIHCALWRIEIRGIYLTMDGKIILGIESSCDETAAAVVSGGDTILSSIVASQIAIHRKYGGVVPELASREHLRQIVPVVREALEQAGVTLRDLDAVAVTRGPGLVGALLVGITYGKVSGAGAREAADWRKSSGGPRSRGISGSPCWWAAGA